MGPLKPQKIFLYDIFSSKILLVFGTVVLAFLCCVSKGCKLTAGGSLREQVKGVNLFPKTRNQPVLKGHFKTSWTVKASRAHPEHTGQRMQQSEGCFCLIFMVLGGSHDSSLCLTGREMSWIMLHSGTVRHLSTCQDNWARSLMSSWAQWATSISCSRFAESLGWPAARTVIMLRYL